MKFDFRIVFADGSSPRVWGTSIILLSSAYNARFIPTCVGNICHDARAGIDRAVHPHVCGEHFSYRFLIDLPGGSSPRVWGT